MADYCLASDVKILLGYSSEFTTTSSPTLAEVNNLIDITTGELDFYLESIGIPVQPTNENLLKQLKIACMYCVAGMICIATSGNVENIKNTQGDLYLQKCEKIKEMILKNKSNYGVVEQVNTKFISSDFVEGISDADKYNNSFVDIDFKV